MFTLFKVVAQHSSSPVEQWCYEHLSRQFEYMAPMQIWNIVSTIQNKTISTTKPKHRGKKRKRDIHDIDELYMSETIHTCTECGGHDVINNQVQVRGADEPMTQFLCCRTCGTMWKEE